MIVEIDINDLAEGHYVIDIVKQKASYALTHANHIKTSQTIEQLKSKGVLSVLVDTSKTLANKKEAKYNFPPDHKSVPSIIEITKAKKLFNHSKAIQQQLLTDFLSDTPINLSPLFEASNQTLNAIYKNPDTLSCIINLRNKGQYLLEHSVSVSILLSIFAHYLNFDKQIIQQLAVGAFLHDIGKVKIPDVLLEKQGRLTPVEYAIVKTHVKHSIQLLEQIPDISELSLEVVALHHERLDGSGYPYQLSGDGISQYGRMIAICDTFDALTNNKPYKNGYCAAQAFAILRKLAHKGELDLSLVDAFIKCLGIYPVGSLVELSSGKIAIVETKNAENSLTPHVRSFYDLNDRRYIMAQDINLAHSEESIVKAVRAEDYRLDMNRIIEFLLMQG